MLHPEACYVQHKTCGTVRNASTCQHFRQCTQHQTSREKPQLVAILEPRWCPCQIQVLSQKLTGGGPGRWRQVGRCPPKSARFWAKNSHFSRKRAPKPGQNAQTKGNGGYTPRAVSLPCVKEPSGALQLRDMSEKRPKEAPKSPKICAMCTNTPKPSTGRILGYVAQIRIPRAPSPPATPHILWFPSLIIAQRDA